VKRPELEEEDWAVGAWEGGSAVGAWEGGSLEASAGDSQEALAGGSAVGAFEPGEGFSGCPATLEGFWLRHRFR
jgi:hypothetical protein